MQRVGINRCNKLVEFTMESTKAISDEWHEPGLSVQGGLTILVDFFAGSDLDSLLRKKPLWKAFKRNGLNLRDAAPRRASES